MAGVDRAPQALINDRRAKCAQCPHVVTVLAEFCGVCGCLIVAKTALAGEECPLPEDQKKWERHII
jgi:hypothetical protein